MNIHFPKYNHFTHLDRAAVKWSFEHGAASLKKGESIECESARVLYKITKIFDKAEYCYLLERWSACRGRDGYWKMLFQPGRRPSLRAELRRKWLESMKQAELDEQPELALNY